jgi:hypothetical protein
MCFIFISYLRTSSSSITCFQNKLFNIVVDPFEVRIQLTELMWPILGCCASASFAPDPQPDSGGGRSELVDTTGSAAPWPRGSFHAGPGHIFIRISCTKCHGAAPVGIATFSLTTLYNVMLTHFCIAMLSVKLLPYYGAIWQYLWRLIAKVLLIF